MAVAIQIPNGDRMRVISTGVVTDRRAERAVAIAQHHAHFAVTALAPSRERVGHDEVGNSIAVHVPDRDRKRFTPSRAVSSRSFERAVAVAHKHTYRTGCPISHHEVQLAIAL